MPSIILIRHGPVALKASGLLSFEGFRRYCDAYELSGLEPDAEPPRELARLVRAAKCVFASDAPRVIDTLAGLGVAADVVDAAFREAPPQAPQLPIQLPMIVWLALARARGVLDPALTREREDLRLRSATCAEMLIDATAAGPVMLAGHGWFNRHVAATLVKNGWRGFAGPGFAKPFGYKIFASVR